MDCLRIFSYLFVSYLLRIYLRIFQQLLRHPCRFLRSKMSSLYLQRLAQKVFQPQTIMECTHIQCIYSILIFFTSQLRLNLDPTFSLWMSLWSWVSKAMLDFQVARYQIHRSWLRYPMDSTLPMECLEHFFWFAFAQHSTLQEKPCKSSSKQFAINLQYSLISAIARINMLSVAPDLLPFVAGFQE